MIDEIVLLALCAALGVAALSSDNPAPLVAAFLVATAATGLAELAHGKWAHLAVGGAFLAACCTCPQAALFAPLGAYIAVSQNRWTFCLPWAIPPLLWWEPLGLAVLGGTMLLLGLGACEAFRTQRRETEEAHLRQLRDDLQENHLALAERARNLQERQDLEVHCAILDERARIAREIHDNVGHLLTRAVLQGRALAVSQADNPAVAAAMEPLEATLNEALTTVRRSVHNLHDEAFDPQVALEEAVRGLPSLEGKLHFEAHQLPRPVALACIAIVREGLSNASTHGHATAATVALEEFPGFFRLSICDNGTPQREQGEEGLGIASMKQRAEALGGTFTFSRLEPPQQGSRIFATFPKTQEQL